MGQSTKRSQLLTAVLVLFACAVCVEAWGRAWHAQRPHGFSPAPRKFHSAVSYEEGFVFFGGTNGAVSFNDVFYWDLGNEYVSNWTASDPSSPWPAARHLHAVMPTGTGFLMHGGHLGAGVAFADDMWEFDFNSKSWTRVVYHGSSVPPPRAAHAAALIGDEVWIYGGTGPSPEGPEMPNIGYQDLWKFNLTTREWTEVAATNEPGIRTGIVGAVDQESLIFYGGQDMDGNAYEGTYMYDTRQDRWFSSIYTLPPNSFYQGSANGKSYFMYGGTNTEESNNALWELDQDNVWHLLSVPSYPGSAPRVSGSAGGNTGGTFAVFGGADLPGGSVSGDFYTFE